MATDKAAARERLYAALCATPGDAGKRLKAFLAKARTAALHEPAKGVRMARALSASMDDALSALFDAAGERAGAARVAVAAVGGYGRNVLAPHSDVDLLFLHPAGADAQMRPFLDAALYPLWDAGLKVGHAVRTPADAIAFARGDLNARTAMLDARFLWGERKLFDDFAKRYEKLRKRTVDTFIAAKLEERKQRLERSHASRYLLEPDVKEGKGGLRDIQTLYWLAKYASGDRRAGEGAFDALVSEGMLTAQDLRRFRRATDFLWSVRIRLHALTDRADEKLTFDLQPRLAEALGYVDRPSASAVERFMHHYFLVAKDVGQLTRSVCAALEVRAAGRGGLKPVPAEWRRDEAGGADILRLRNGRLAFSRRRTGTLTPVEMFRLFRAVARGGMDVHPDAMQRVTAAARGFDREARKDPDVAALFRATLMDAEGGGRALRLMAETGLLGKYIPAFGRLEGRVEYGLYRRHTFDEFAIRGVEALNMVRRGEYAREHPISTACVKTMDDMAPLALALLIQDAVYALPKPTDVRAERLARAIARRAGLDAAAAGLTGWLTINRDLLSHASERRVVSDPRVVERFADACATRTRLDALLVFTVCVARAGGDHVWDDWRRRRIAALYHGAAAFLEGGAAGLEKSIRKRSASARLAVGRRMADWPQADREGFFTRVGDAFWLQAEPETAIRFAELLRDADYDKRAAAVETRARGDGFAEAVIFAADRPGLFADLAGAVTDAGGSVREAITLPAASGEALDHFVIERAGDLDVTDAGWLQKLQKKIARAAERGLDRAPSPPRLIGDRRHVFQVPPVVRFDLDASDDDTVVEAEGRDRPGLLHLLASALAETGVMITAAHVATYGERAVDTFYLQDAPGYKITNKRRLASIERRLIAALR